MVGKLPLCLLIGMCGMRKNGLFGRFNERMKTFIYLTTHKTVSKRNHLEESGILIPKYAN